MVEDSVYVLVDYDSSFKNDTIVATQSGSSNFTFTRFDSKYVTSGKPTYLRFVVQYAPTSQGTDTLQILLTRNGEKCKYALKLSGWAIPATPENAAIPLANFIPPTVAFVTPDDTSRRYLALYNNFGHALRIDTIRLLKAVSFRIDTALRYPDTLAPNTILELPLAFEPKQKGLNQDYLIVGVPDKPILFDVIPIQGFFNPTSSVRINITRTAHFAVFPNPSHGDLTVHSDGLSRSRVEIMDMLGRTLTASSFAHDWRWDRKTSDGNTVSSGAYFLIVSGTTDAGEHVREVQSLVLE
jgi:hypothetical protein